MSWVCDGAPIIMERDPLALDDPVVTQDFFCCQVCSILAIGFTNYNEKEKADIIEVGRPQPNLESLIVASPRHTRCFNPNLYKSYDWLTGCESRSKLFCWPCLLFSDKNSQWNSRGLSDLNNLHCALNRHAVSQIHLEAFLKLKTFGKIGANVSQTSALGSLKISKEGQVFTNREIMKTLIQMICFLGNNLSPDNIGEVNHSDPIGRDRFLDFFNLMSEFDNTLKRNVNNKKAFLGPNVRNNLITSISDMVLQNIKEEIKSSHFLSIILSEVAELGDSVLVSIIVRFITNNFLVCERFFGFRQVPSSRLAEPLFDIINNVVNFTDCGLKVVSYSYDGGVILTDQLPQFQSKMDKLCPNALNVHYNEHQLSSVLQQSLSSLTECKHFFSTINSLSLMFIKSKKLRDELNVLLCRRKPNSTDFDWCINGSIIKNIFKIRQPLIELFENISRFEDEWGFETVFFTAGYLTTLKTDVSFNLLLYLLSEVFVLADDLSDVLKVTVDDVMICTQKVKEFIDILQIKRDCFYSIYQETVNFLGDNEPPLKKIKSEECLQISTDSYKIIYESVLWNMISHLNCRFRDLSKLQFMSFKSLKLIKKGKGVTVVGLSNFLPSFFAISTLCTELNVLAKYQPINESSPMNLLKYLKLMDLESTFPQIVSFCELILTLPAGKSTAVFNSIKNYIQKSSISHQLSNLAIISIENELVKELLKHTKFYDEVIADFMTKDASIQLGFVFSIE